MDETGLDGSRFALQRIQQGGHDMFQEELRYLGQLWPGPVGRDISLDRFAQKPRKESSPAAVPASRVWRDSVERRNIEAELAAGTEQAM